MECTFDGCDRPKVTRGLCPSHYRQYLAGKELHPLQNYRWRTGTCSFEGCDREIYARGYCMRHYDKQRRGIPLADIQKQKNRDGHCEYASCSLKIYADRLCASHYRQKIEGKELAPLRNGKNPQWRKHHQGYIYKSVPTSEPRKSRMIFQHREVMEQHLGRPLEKHENVHHMNGMRDDNRIENLELWSRGQPPGQRARDKLQWAREIIRLYEPLEQQGLI